MIKIVGLESGRLYAEGRREDCFRQLKDQYSYVPSRDKTYGRVYPEPLIIVFEESPKIK